MSKGGIYTSGVILEVEDLFQRQARELDPKKREALLHQIQEILPDSRDPRANLRARVYLGRRSTGRGAWDQHDPELRLLGALRGSQAQASVTIAARETRSRQRRCRARARGLRRVLAEDADHQAAGAAQHAGGDDTRRESRSGSRVSLHPRVRDGANPSNIRRNRCTAETGPAWIISVLVIWMPRNAPPTALR